MHRLSLMMLVLILVHDAAVAEDASSFTPKHGDFINQLSSRGPGQQDVLATSLANKASAMTMGDALMLLEVAINSRDGWLREQCDKVFPLIARRAALEGIEEPSEDILSAIQTALPTPPARVDAKKLVARLDELTKTHGARALPVLWDAVTNPAYSANSYEITQAISKIDDEAAVRTLLFSIMARDGARFAWADSYSCKELLLKLTPEKSALLANYRPLITAMVHYRVFHRTISRNDFIQLALKAGDAATGKAVVKAIDERRFSENYRQTAETLATTE